MFSFLADEQLEDSTKESSLESKGETEVPTTAEGGNDSTAESSAQGGVDKQVTSDESPAENIPQNGTDGMETTAKDDETSNENTPIAGDEDSVKVHI